MNAKTMLLGDGRSSSIPRIRLVLTIAALLILIATLPLFAAQDSVDSAMETMVHTLAAVKTFSEVDISPDGQHVAWVERLAGVSATPHSMIYVSDLNGETSPVQITAGVETGGHSEAAISWSPDSKRLAFLSDAAAPGQPQLYIASVAAGRAVKLTDVRGFLADTRWSPDGKCIAFLLTENATRAAGPLAAESHQTGVIQETVNEQRLTVVDVSAGTLRQISPADMYVYEYGWSPDSKRFVTTAAHGNGDNNWYIAQIYTIDARGGPMRAIYKPPLQVARPVWSADGRSIAFISGLMSDEVSTGGDIFVMSPEGGEAKNMTPGLKASVRWIAWQVGNQLLFQELIDGGSAICSIDIAAGQANTLSRGDDQITVSASPDGKMLAMIRSSYSRPPEIWAGTPKNMRQITSRNADLVPGWGEVKNIHWNNDGLSLQGWLLYPRNFDPHKKYPLIVEVHGGPGAMARQSWPNSRNFMPALSGFGYFVLFPNPRGSFGQGETFARANVRDFGYGDFHDIMAGVDEVIKTAPVDEHRLGITGWSYGGYMTMWAVTQTNRFAAAVAGAGVANLQSYYGQNQIDQWLIPFFGASVYDDPAIYARSSPITFIKNARTPTLVLVGDSDGECPPAQSYEFWHALKTLGVETELVVYENEGHSFAKPDHVRDLFVRITRWFDQHLN